MPIKKPTLPPMAGYVEVEYGGSRAYRNVQTGEIYGYESPTETQLLGQAITALETDKADKSELNELTAAIERGLTL